MKNIYTICITLCVLGSLGLSAQTGKKIAARDLAEKSSQGDLILAKEIKKKELAFSPTAVQCSWRTVGNGKNIDEGKKKFKAKNLSQKGLE